MGMDALACSARCFVVQKLVCKAARRDVAQDVDAEVDQASSDLAPGLRIP